MSVDFLFQYSALELFWLLVPILVGIAVVETLAIYFFKLKGKNDFKEWILNISMGILSPIYLKRFGIVLHTRRFNFLFTSQNLSSMAMGLGAASNSSLF